MTDTAVGISTVGISAGSTPTLNGLVLSNNLSVGGTITGNTTIRGTATLVAGTVTVNTSAVTAAGVIMVTRNTPGGTAGDLRVATRTAGVSFIITSASAVDTSTVDWLVIS